MYRAPISTAANFYDQTKAAYDFCLANFLYKEAAFFAERLFAELKDAESEYMLALAFFHNQELGRAYIHLQNNPLPEARYLLARCCFQLLKWEEAEEALRGDGEVANGAAGLYLLGIVKERQAKREEAMENYIHCLELCPFMFHAFERLSWWSLSSNPQSKCSFSTSFFTDERFSKCSTLNAQQNVVGRWGASSAKAAPPWSFACLLRVLAQAVHAFHEFETTLCFQILHQLPRRQGETGYVIELMARCHMEAGDYRRAEHLFSTVDTFEPRRVSGLEYYSTVLWHLKKDVECTHLAQRALEWDRMQPQVWCVLGNCFSLQNEHDTAIKFFKRAIQIDPSFCYAYTLCGHEFVSNEKFDKAIPMFEQALSIDPRHYNAWWGLGNIYYRQEEHENAQYHFRKALEINKHNGTLKCYLGLVLECLHNPILALGYFDGAINGEGSENSMALLLRANVLMNLERHTEALRDLEKLRSLAPKEGTVHYQLGKVYKKLRQDKKALLHFNIAMDLNKDSKDYHQIKAHIEMLNLKQSNGSTSPINSTATVISVGDSDSTVQRPSTLGSSLGMYPVGMRGLDGSRAAPRSLRYVRPPWQAGPGSSGPGSSFTGFRL